MNRSVEPLLAKAGDYVRRGMRREAISVYRQVLTMAPALADAWYDLGWLLRAEGDYEASLAAYDRALALNVASPEEVHLNRAAIFADSLRLPDQAEAALRAALASRPEFPPALLNLGNLAEERGDREEAAAFYNRILEHSEETARHGEIAGEAAARLLHLAPPSSAADPQMKAARALASANALPAITQANLWFAIGRALDATGAFDEAFAAFAEANRAQALTGPPYDAARNEAAIDALIAAFASPQPSGAAATAGLKPLFICGMFRSGSTLLERVLAGLPEVTAGDELDLLSRMTAGPLAPFPASIARLTDARAGALAHDYRAALARLFPGATRFVSDKRPDNFLRIGLIKRLFPDAKIVHTVRRPLDVGLSIFSHHIDQRQAPYSSSLAATGHYFGQYRRLMAHWKALYTDDIFDFDYDAFVSAPEKTLRQLLSFLELEWDDGLLEFHARKDVVKTASYWQVRRPLFPDSSGRWRNYEKSLAPLREALLSAGVDPGD